IQTCPHEENYRINISGTGIREMLREGIMPPKEIIRPESARIAMQGAQPKGLEQYKQATLPAWQPLNSTLPLYLHATRLGGKKLETPLTPVELTNRDLELAIRALRDNADRIYKAVSDEYNSVGDINRNLQPDWQSEARESILKQQQMVIE